MNLQTFLQKKFQKWKPQAPVVTERTKCSVTLEWRQEEFGFLRDQMLYRIEMKKKLPAWVVVYSGGKTSKMIDNLPPRYPQVFRLIVIVKSTAVPHLARRAVQFYGDDKTVFDELEGGLEEGSGDGKDINSSDNNADSNGIENCELNEEGDAKLEDKSSKQCWLTSQHSEETWTNTDTDGSSAVCFYMAVCCGYIKQVQAMLEERPELIGVANPTNGFTPLAGAVRKGDLNTVKFLLSAGADIEQRSYTKQTVLHLALLAANVPMVVLLLDHGADLKARDLNQLRAEHYAADSGSVEVLDLVMQRGGDLTVVDNNGWTPLFRVLSQNGRTDMISELVARGSGVDIRDDAGMPLLSVARLLTNRLGRNRDSVLRVVDRHFPHERALALFTRLTRKIHHVHTVFK